MWIVSDGSHKEEKGTYGWVIATDTNVVWQGNGRARGNPMNSHRAEAYGMLASLVFLRHVTRFMGIKLHCHVIRFCDNKALVDSVGKEQIRVTAGLALAADWDIFVAIIEEQCPSNTNKQ